MSKEVMAELGRIALEVSATDRELLDFVARHPFVSADNLALVFDWDRSWARRRCSRLVGLGLMRRMTPKEVGEKLAGRDLVELTYWGLAFAAAQQGLSLSAAVRYNGLAGGGPDDPIGARESLVRYVVHTLGVNAVCLEWYRVARLFAERGGDDEVVEWRNSAACSRKIMRPDGYIQYRHGEEMLSVFMEYDRGKMSYRDHCAKFRIYAGYIKNQLYKRDYGGMPRILVITTNDGAEARIGRAVLAVKDSTFVRLPVLTTTVARVRSPHNADSLLGRIWQAPNEAPGDPDVGLIE